LDFLAQLAGYQSASKETNHRLQDLLSVAFTEMSGALLRCGVSQEQAVILRQSLISLKGFHFCIDVTSARLHNSEVSVDLQQAVRAWSKKRWDKFGEDMGKLLQQLVLLALPRLHQYSTGGLVLRRGVLQSFSMQRLQRQLGKHSTSLALIRAVAFVSLALLALAAAAAALRAFPRCFDKRWNASGDCLPSVEDATDSDGALLAL